VQSLAKSLFKKEQICDPSFCPYLQKSKRIALFKIATKRAIALSLFVKDQKNKNEQKMSNPSFFNMSECSTLGQRTIHREDLHTTKQIRFLQYMRCVPNKC